MSFRRTGLGLLFALATGCGAAPTSSLPATPTQPGSLTRATPPPTPIPAAPAPPAPPPETAAPGLPKPDDNREKEPPTKTGKTEVEEAPRAATAAATFNGSMSQADIRDVIVQHEEVFDDCYRIGAGKSGQFVATVTVKATIGPTGNVNVSEIIRSTSKNKQVNACVAEAFKKMKFPRPKGGATSVITFPIDFNGAEQVQ